MYIYLTDRHISKCFFFLLSTILGDVYVVNKCSFAAACVCFTWRMMSAYEIGAAVFARLVVRPVEAADGGSPPGADQALQIARVEEVLGRVVLAEEEEEEADVEAAACEEVASAAE